MSALLILNLQNDLCESNKYIGGDVINIIPKINKLRNNFNNIFFVRNCYSKFNNFNKTYCLKSTYGCQINHNIILDHGDMYIDIGTMELYDSSSAFYIAQEIKKKSELKRMLKSKKIKNLYICGLSINGSIFNTCIDAYQKYNVKIVEDVCMYDIDDNKIKKSNEYLKNLGIEYIKLDNILSKQ